MAFTGNCTKGTHPPGVFIICPYVKIPEVYGMILEVLLTLDLSGVSGNPQVQIGITDSVEDILKSAEPIILAHGSNLYGIASISVKC